MSDDMLTGYLECALWAGLDWSPVNAGEDNPIPLDENFSVEDISDEARHKILADCESFIDQAGDLIAEWPYEYAHIGHDLYLTRNGHGAGFWDRFASGSDLGRIGDLLSNIARDMGKSELYVGDDGKLYL